MKKEESRCFDWDNITINKYYEIKDILDDKDMDDITKNVKIVSIITDKDEDEIWNMELTEVGDYVDKLKFLNKFDIPKRPDMKITLPHYNIEVMKDTSKINVAQYVDFQSFVTLPLRDGIDKILSVFLIPKGKNYNTDYDILDLQKEIRENLSFRIAQGLLGFFLRGHIRSLIHFLDYSEKELKKEKNQDLMAQMKKKRMEVEQRLKDLIHLIG